MRRQLGVAVAHLRERQIVRVRNVPARVLVGLADVAEHVKSRGLREPGDPLEIRNDGDASEIEGVLPRPFVAGLRALNVIDGACQRICVGMRHQITV